MQWPTYLFFVYLAVLRKVTDCGGAEGCLVGYLRLEDKGGGGDECLVKQTIKTDEGTGLVR